MRLDSATRSTVYNLVSAYDQIKDSKIRNTLLDVLNEKLSEYLDPDATYSRTSIKLSADKSEIEVTLCVSEDELDETEYDCDDVIHVINVRTGKVK